MDGWESVLEERGLPFPPLGELTGERDRVMTGRAWEVLVAASGEGGGECLLHPEHLAWGWGQDWHLAL